MASREVYQIFVIEENDSILPDNGTKILSQDLFLWKSHHEIPKSCITMEETTIVTLVGYSLVLGIE